MKCPMCKCTNTIGKVITYINGHTAEGFYCSNCFTEFTKDRILPPMYSHEPPTIITPIKKSRLIMSDRRKKLIATEAVKIYFDKNCTPKEAIEESRKKIEQSENELRGLCGMLLSAVERD